MERHAYRLCSCEDRVQRTACCRNALGQVRGFWTLVRHAAGWQKAVNADQLLGFKFEGYTMGANSEIGHSWHDVLQLAPSSGEWTPNTVRQATFSRCLVRAELDQLARIQGTINQRRPPLPEYFKKNAREDSLLGRHLRELYDPSPEYLEGQSVSFQYYSIEDVRDFVTFIVAVLPSVLDRFMEGRVAKAIDTTPAHLKPKWLRDLKSS